MAAGFEALTRQPALQNATLNSLKVSGALKEGCVRSVL